jgi:hypothetical protein
MNNNRFLTFYNSVKEYLGFLHEDFFLGRRKWLYPLIFLLVITVLSIELIVSTYYRIDMMLPKAFPDWEAFQVHVEKSIIQVLKDNNQIDWADLVFGALYVSQSYYERKGELLRALTALKCQSLAKQLGIKPAIEKALSYLHSLGGIKVS